MQYASPWSRFLSTFADLTILRIWLDFISLLAPVTWIQNNSIVLAVFMGCVALTYVLPRFLFRRQTFGMWLFGYGILKNHKSKPLTWFEEVLRFLSQGVSTLLLFLPFMYSFFNKRSAHFSDLVVDSSPQTAPTLWSRAQPLQKLLGLLLVYTAIGSVYSIFAKSPAVDIFARIFKGEVARIIHVLLAASGFVLGGMNILGKKRAPHATAIFYLLILISTASSLFVFDTYKARASQNLIETINSQSNIPGAVISAAQVKNFIKDADNHLQKNLLAAIKINLAINFLLFGYMFYLILRNRIDPVLNATRQRLFGLLQRIPHFLRSKTSGEPE